jgi:membrane protease YdiL (CAAX protease family)
VVLVIYFIVQSAVALVFAISRLVSNPNLDVFDMISKLGSDGLLISIATILSAIFGLAFILLFVALRKGIRPGQYLNLHNLPLKTIWILLGVFAGLLAISVIVSNFSSKIEDPGFTVDAFNTSRWPALFGVAVVVFAPIFEETFFRGFLFQGLRGSALGANGTILLTSALWALLHLQYNGYGMAEIFILGIVFGIVRLKTDSLYASLFLHGLWNLAAFVAAAVFVSAQ